MGCTVIVGGQWGDEAKGKIASYLALSNDVDVAIRAGLGPGAGHTVSHDGRTLKLRQVPSAVINPKTRLLLGAGMLVRPEVLLREIQELRVGDRLGIDYRATVIDEEHVMAEQANQLLTGTVRTTGSGHGPALAARAMRSAKRAEQVPELAPYLVDAAEEANGAVDRGDEVQVEGTIGFSLSVLYGTYPYTVAKDSTASTAAADVGLGPLAIDEVVVVFRAFPTRVGAGPFPTELPPEESAQLGIAEVGTVTGRPRRLGRFDIEQAREALRINRPSCIALTFLDYMDRSQRGKWQAPLGEGPAAQFVRDVENELGRSIDLLGTGPETRDVIDLRRNRVRGSLSRTDTGS